MTSGAIFTKHFKPKVMFVSSIKFVWNLKKIGLRCLVKRAPAVSINKLKKKQMERSSVPSTFLFLMFVYLWNENETLQNKMRIFKGKDVIITYMYNDVIVTCRLNR